MTYPHAKINPFYANRLRRVMPSRPESKREPGKPTFQHHPSPGRAYALLPLIPRTASPVPHLTSLYHFSRAGEYGDRNYPGNCGGTLIKDLLRFFSVRSVFDPMT